MNIYKILNRKGKQKAGIARIFTAQFFVTLFAVGMVSNAVAVPPPIKDCKRKWAFTSQNSGLVFGSFSIESAGSVTLTGGGARTSTGGVNLVASPVSSYKVTIDNTLSPECNAYNITVSWNNGNSPDNRKMKPAGNNPKIPVTNTVVDFSDIGVTTLPHTYKPASLPFDIEVTALMTPTVGTPAGPYTSGVYKLKVKQGNKAKRSSQARSTTTAITPLTIAPGLVMDFGQIAAGSATTTVSVDASGVVTAPAGPGNAIVTISTGSPLTFTIQGEAGQAYNLNIADGVLDDGGAGATMPITITGDDRPILDGSPQQVTVTGNLLVGSGQAGGMYSTGFGSGTPIVVTIDYN